LSFAGLGQRLGAQAAFRGFLLIAGSAVIWIGVGFGAYAIYVAFVPALGTPWAAAAASGLLLAGPLSWVLVMQLRRPHPHRPTPDPRRAQNDEDKAVLQLLAGVAKEKPLLAVLFAGLIGAAETVRRRGED
jgi:hypothetical protein